MKWNFDKLAQTERRHFYMSNMRPLYNERALFSDGTEDYVKPCQPSCGDMVTVYFRAAIYNLDSVYLIRDDIRQEMMLDRQEGVFEYYKASFEIGEQVVTYYFETKCGNLVGYYNQSGASMNHAIEYDFRLIPNFSTPEWAKGAVIYQIFVDRFYNGDTSNDPIDNEYIYIHNGITQVRDWNQYPATMGVREFYGGDLQGVLDKMDYFEHLGIDVIYFNPLFVSPSNHKYDIQDYDYIDPHFGKIVNDEGEPLSHGDHVNRNASRYITRVTDKENLEASNALFAQLVEEAHRRGIRVILDGVFNHCGSFNKWLDREQIYQDQDNYDKGAFVSQDSPYRTFFRFNEYVWPYNRTYDGWWGYDTLPKLNYEESPALVEDIMRIGRKWVSAPYHVDGWRLDVAADLGHSQDYNHQFWKRFRKEVKAANPDAIILAEHYGNPSGWLNGDEWDTVMNYDAFMEPVTWFLTGMEKHSDEFRHDLLGNADSFFHSMAHHMSKFTTPSLQVAMNELSNHDHSRFLTRTNRCVGRVENRGSEAANHNVSKSTLRQAVVIQMTWPGAPTIYYGDEAGVCGWTDPDNRRTYPWGREDHELIEFHRQMIRIHKENKALLTGSYKQLMGGYQYLVYGRFQGLNIILVVVNNNIEELGVEVPVWELGIEPDDTLECLMLTTDDGFYLPSQEDRMFEKVEGLAVKLKLPKLSAAVYRRVME